MTQRHAVEVLFERLERVKPYPSGVVPVPDRIPGWAGFPGGSGLWGTQPGRPLPPAPIGQVVVVGHNFDNLAGFERSLRRGAESLRGPFWRNLLDLFDRVGLARERCFFTNAYMGLIDGPTNVGRFPGAADPAFSARCVAFLAEQLAMLQPRVVVTLGSAALPLVARLAEGLERAWANAGGLVALDRRGAALRYPVHFDRVPH